MIALLYTTAAFAQSAPTVPDRPWHYAGEEKLRAEARQLGPPRFSIDPAKTYTLGELIDLAESHNPLTRVAWENARAQAAALGVVRSELYPTLAAIALAQVSRSETGLGSRFYRQTLPAYQATLDLNYTILDFGARSGRIAAASAGLLAANFAFNDVHRNVIYQVQQAYYRLLNTSAQEDAARASLANAEAVQQSAEDRLRQGLATLPDVLEARSTTAQAQYDLQAVLGAEQIAQGDLAAGLGTMPGPIVRIQPLNELPVPETIGETVEDAMGRAFEQRPDVLRFMTEIKSANARVKEARAAFYPVLSVSSSSAVQSLYILQQTLPSGHTADLTGGIAINLNWTVFDGGRRRNRLLETEAEARASEAQLSAARDQVADEVWAAYSNVNTALRQRDAAVALLEATTQSYAAALESYNLGVRNLLDVTAAQRALAQARSADVLARTQVLAALADLAFRVGDSIQPSRKRP